MQSVSTPLPSSTSSMPSTLHAAMALAPLQQAPSQAEEFELFAQQLLGQTQSMAAAANAEISQRDAAIAAETQRRIAAEQTAGQIQAAAEQKVGSLQGEIQIKERQAMLALQSAADLHSQRMVQLQTDNQVLAQSIASQAQAQITAVQQQKQKDIDQLVSIAELDRQELIAQITEERAQLERARATSEASVLALRNQVTDLGKAMSEQGTEANRLIQLKQQEIDKTKTDYELQYQKQMATNSQEHQRQLESVH
jgi:hypothetical protein